MDQKVPYCGTIRMTGRWARVVFFYKVDIGAMSSIIVCMKLHIFLQYMKIVRRALIITITNSLAGITTYDNPHVQRQISMCSCPASKNTNERGRCYMSPSRRET